MKYILVSCKDIKSNLFTPPVPFRSKEEAVRAYGEAIPRDPMLSKYPSDFELHSVATWDNETGDLYVVGERIINVAEIRTLAQSESEVAANSGSKFPEVPEEGDQSVVQEGSLAESQGRICFGGVKK